MKKFFDNTFWQGFNFALFSAVALLISIISIVTYIFQDHVTSSKIILFLLQHHLQLMIISMIILVAYGFWFERLNKKYVLEGQEISLNISELLRKFLSREELEVIIHLLENSGKSTQSNISKIENFGNVKALRIVQKLSEKDILTIKKEGKVRKIYLNSKLFDLFRKINFEKEMAGHSIRTK